jgi:hypothetical protein
MWIEAIISKEDLVTVLNQLLPVKIHLDDNDKTNRWLYLDRATEIELVAEKGLRVACPAEIKWSIMGVDVPIRLHTMKVMLRPEIVKKSRGDILVFNIELEEADIKGIPALVDHGIMNAVNAALAGKELAWDFTKTLTQTVGMPKLLDPIDSLSINVGWGKKRVDAEALVLAVSFHLTFNRGD